MQLVLAANCISFVDTTKTHISMEVQVHHMNALLEAHERANVYKLLLHQVAYSICDSKAASQAGAHFSAVVTTSKPGVL